MKKIRCITVVGLGLIGGSLAAASRKAFPRTQIIGVSRSRAALAKARKRNWIHEGTQDLNRGIRSSQLVILCTPVDTFKTLLKRIERAAQSPLIVTDTGSVKGFLVRWVDHEKWRRVNFVGAHPMAGSHERGIDAARPHLFDHALTFITPGRRTSPRVLAQVRNFWEKVSSRVAIVSPEKHDRLTAEISHFPHLVAALIINNTSPSSFSFAASGFFDTTRVAQGDSRLWAPIFLENQKELERLLLKFQAKMEWVRRILKKGEISKLQKVLGEAQRRRSHLQPFNKSLAL